MPETTVLNPATRTRVAVKYDYDPSKDYWRLIESQCPAWQPPELADAGSGRRGRGSGRAVTWEDESAQTRVVMIDVPGHGPVEWVMPFQKYVPAVDPSGNICPLTTHTCRLPEDSEREVAGFGDKIIAAKKRAGWFIATRDQEYQGLVDQEYAAFLCALIPLRKAAHSARQAEEDAKFYSGAEKLMIQQQAQIAQAVTDGAAANREVMMDVAKAVGVEVAKQMANVGKQAQQSK